MVMPKPKGGDFERPPTGMQRAVCVQVFDIGLHPGYQGVGFKPNLIMLFELEAKMAEGDFAGKRFLVSRQYTQSLHEKATFRKHLESWRAKTFDEDAVAAFCAPPGTDVLHGKQATLNLMETESGFVKIDSILPPMEGEKLVPEYSGTPEWIQKKIDEGFALEPRTDGAPSDDFEDDVPF